MPTPHRGRHPNEPREVADLHRLVGQHPELAPAATLQLDVLALNRRIAARIPLPSRLTADPRLTTLPADGTPLLRFPDLPLDWSDVGFVLRESLELLHRADIVESSDARRLSDLLRDGPALRAVVGDWFETTRLAAARWPATDEAPSADAAPDQWLVVGLKPFLARCAEAIGPRLHLTGWQRGVCPLCGGEPELGILPADGRPRELSCGRCTLRWPFDLGRCHACGHDDPARLVSFRGRDPRYRLDACELCRRYLKVVDERRGGRPALPAVDTIATLPLDAAAMNRGYGG